MRSTRSKKRGSVLVEYLLLSLASITAASVALSAIQDAHRQILDQIQTILLGR